MRLKNKYLLFLVILLGIFLRSYRLNSVPSGLYVDEAAIGYNAYSMLMTGADEYGKRWPILLRSFEAYSSPLYTYASVLPVAIFGLNEVSVRLWSVIAGVVAILLIYLISEESLWAALLMAISPWGIFLSRMGTEGHLGFMIWLAGIYTYQRARKNNRWLVVSFCFWALAMNCYQAMRLIVPLTMIGFWIFLPIKNRWKNIWTYWAIGIFSLINFPQLLLLTTKSFGVRAGGLFYGEAISKLAGTSWLPFPVAWLYYFMAEFWSQFVAYFNPYTLFYLGDADLQRSIPEVSAFPQWMVIPYLYGIYLLIKNIKTDRSKLIIITALAASIVPSLTKDPFSSVRGQGLILPMVLIMSSAVEKLVTKNTTVRIIITGFVLLSLLNWWRYYFWVFPAERAVAWSYGYKQLTEEITKRPDDRFLIDMGRIKPPYIELLFFLKYPPQEYQKQFSQIRSDYYSANNYPLERTINNVEMRNIDWEKDIYKDQIIIADSLAISSNQVTEHQLTKVFEVDDYLGKIIFAGYSTNPLKKCISDNYKSKECDYFRKR